MGTVSSLPAITDNIEKLKHPRDAQTRQPAATIKHISQNLALDIDQIRNIIITIILAEMRAQQRGSLLHDVWTEDFGIDEHGYMDHYPRLERCKDGILHSCDYAKSPEDQKVIDDDRDPTPSANPLVDQ